MNNWRTITTKDLEQLKKAGKIRDYKMVERKEKVAGTGGRIVSKHFKKRSEEKDWIAWNLLYWTNSKAVNLEEEYKFHPDRGWRADWAIPTLKILVEYEGIMNVAKSRHTTIDGFINDTEKYNAAASLGWKVFRFTANNYKNLLTELDKLNLCE